ncbi:MAG: hypothetical protein US63_C0010G0015 [Candidatus Moranbacteria bacterium GW2011_GWC2_37_8]|nr:MAG: hypothetical protein US63_C0010G0015 [Candidatus Moranbacteria bacterium GW2011_GWC2_37_8]KKQ63355.1 MAG: hypothetical protein US82_C0001G0024 [Parcubacteria group bacterium GW2011_GWC1_38_22]KKQ79798.1 MAG: hypothetical protein UT03_C0041G0003 [Candidatus Moranbacteria bacterium GW2011_GWD2_38_7]
MPKIIIASGPVIIRDNKVLLDIQGEDKFWKFCGGKVLENETLQQTAIRRAKEELGIDIKITNSEPFLLHTSKERDGEIFDVILVHFLADFSGEIHPSDEVREFEWHKINNLPKNLAPNILPVLKHFR